MKQWFLGLPGPMPLKVVGAAAVAITAIVVLFFVYDWIGINMLDSGGTIG
jgi:hypothetical protein